MRNKNYKIFLIFFFFIILGILFLSTLVSNKDKGLSLSNSINKFNLITHENRKFDNNFVSNYPSLIFFGFLNCPDVCPFTLTKISELIFKLKEESKLLRFYFVTVDPERDKIEDLKEYLNAFHPKIIGITGSNTDIENFLKYMYVYKKEIYLSADNYTIDHSSQIFLFNKRGGFFGTLSLNENDKDILAKIEKIINGA